MIMFSMYLSNNSNIGQHKIFQKYEHKKNLTKPKLLNGST